MPQLSPSPSKFRPHGQPGHASSSLLRLQQRGLPVWMVALTAGILAVWLLLGNGVQRPAACACPPMLPLPQPLAALGSSGSGKRSSDGSSSSAFADGDMPPAWSGSLQTPAAREMVPRLQAREVQATLYGLWSLPPPGTASPPELMDSRLRIPRILHHGE